MYPLPMGKLRRDVCIGESDFEARFLQEGMQGDPWRVTLTCLLLNKTTRRQSQIALMKLLSRWPTPMDLLNAEFEDVVTAIKSCGLQNARARNLQRLAEAWVFAEEDVDLRELPGVGDYAADSVAMFCYGSKDIVSRDKVLRAKLEEMNGANTT